MVTRLHNIMLAMLLMLATLFAGFGAFAQNPASGGYQHFEQGALAVVDDNRLNALAKFAPLAEIATECCNAPNGAIISSPLPDGQPGAIGVVLVSLTRVNKHCWTIYQRREICESAFKIDPPKM